MYYQINITETASNECTVYWTRFLNLDTWKEIKADLIEEAERTGTEHELTISRITPVKNTYFIGAERSEVITRIKHGQTMLDRYLNNLFNN
jgi:hypothetical protein